MDDTLKDIVLNWALVKCERNGLDSVNKIFF